MSYIPGSEVYAVALADAVRESRNKTKLNWAVLAILAVSITFNVIQFNYLPPTLVVAETSDGRIRPLPTIAEPIFSDQHVMNWAASKFESMYDLPFTEVSQYSGRLNTFMLQSSVNDFLEGMKKAGIIDKVRGERLVMRGLRSAPPTITDSYVANGRHIWVVEMPLTILYEGTGGKENRQAQHVVIRGFVGREHLLRADDGLVLGTVEIYQGRP